VPPGEALWVIQYDVIPSTIVALVLQHLFVYRSHGKVRWRSPCRQLPAMAMFCCFPVLVHVNEIACGHQRRHNKRGTSGDMELEELGCGGDNFWQVLASKSGRSRNGAVDRQGEPTNWRE